MNERVGWPGGGQLAFRNSEGLLINRVRRRGLADTRRFDPASGPTGKFALPPWTWSMASWVGSGGGYLNEHPLNFSEPRTA
jgi:hypothetical protein